MRGLTHKEYVRLKLVAAPHHQRSGLGLGSLRLPDPVFFGLRTSSICSRKFRERDRDFSISLSVLQSESLRGDSELTYILDFQRQDKENKRNATSMLTFPHRSRSLYTFEAFVTSIVESVLSIARARVFRGR